jgi:hypothetical protein|tara:strand:+ start:91 stop:417 length:327 start_codon:yes stop_codon:yes gene_type:complete
MNELPPKKEKLDIKEIIMDLKKQNFKSKKEKENFLSKYKHIKTDYFFLYDLVVNNNLDDNTNKEINVLNTILSQLKKIDDKEVTKENGEKMVGELLVDTYIKPQMKNK